MSITFIVLLLITLPIPWIAKMIWPHEVKLVEVGITMAIALAVVSVVYFAGQVGMTYDREIWNGQVASKDRQHGSYTETYSCNCHQTCSGSGNNRSCSETCQTCFREHYTVHWTARTTIGDFGIDSKDWTSSLVYAVPDPQRYSVIQKGDPVSKSVFFTNYVKAVPESLFHANPLLAMKYKDMIPEYPGEIHDIYKINRVLTVGVKVPELDKWNHELSLKLRELGPSKQANAIVVFVNNANPDYQHALEAAWIGGKKNDIILIIGVTKYPTIDWVAVSSWSKSELFKVQLRDAIMDLGEVRRGPILDLLEKHASTSFVRRQMKEFEYLKDEIEPPTWVIVLAAILGILASIAASWYFYHNDPFENSHSYRGGFRRYR